MSDPGVEEYRRRFGHDPPFVGEVMHCVVCHRNEKSDPKVESNWLAFDFMRAGKTVRIYVCPSCANVGPGGVPIPGWGRVAE